MSDIEKTVESGSEQGLQLAESASTIEAPEAPSSDEGQAAESSSQTGKEQVAAGLPEGMTQEKLDESYKSLQGEYTKGQQALKSAEGRLGELDKFGGLEKVMELADWLNSNPRFG